MAISLTNGWKRAVSTAQSAAAVGGKRLAGVTALRTAAGSGCRVDALRNDTLVLRLVLSGQLPIVGTDIKITNAAVASTSTITDADIDTGTWKLRITSADGSEYVEGTLGTSGTDFIVSGGDLVAANGAQLDTITLSLASTLDGGATATPPGTNQDWIVRSTDTAIVVPEDFIGIHTDYLPGNTYPVNPNISASFNWVRSLDWDPDAGWDTRLAWARLEQSAGVYTSSYLDDWVDEHSGKTLVYVIERTPAFYAKYNLPYATQADKDKYHLYQGLQDSSSPPSDWTKCLAFVRWLLNRHKNQNWIVQLLNEPNFTWSSSITESNLFDVRWSKEWIDAGNGPGFYWGSPRESAEAARVLRLGLDADGFGSTPGTGKRFVPLMGPGWQGQAGSNWVGNSGRRFYTCPVTGGKLARDYIDIVDCHHYTYNGDGLAECLDEARAYKARFKDWGVDSKPFTCSEIGHENPVRAKSLSDTAHSDNVIRWAMILSALGFKAMGYYNIDSARDNNGQGSSTAEALFLKFYSAPSAGAETNSNSAFKTAFETAASIPGKTITQACITTDGGVKKAWHAYSDGTTALR